MENPVIPNTFPALRCKNARAAITWLGSAFGFELQSVFAAPDGTIGHAEIRFGAGIVGVNDEGVPDPKNPWGSVRQGVYVCLPDVDAQHERAVAAGADIARPLQDTSYGAREYSVRDLEGHLWSFGTYDMGAKPGEPTIFVGVRYDRPQEAYDWLARAFGFAQALEVPDPNGGLMHGELGVGQGGIMFVESSAHGVELWGDNRQAVYLYVPDPDRHHAQAKAAGAAIVHAPADTPYGARSYSARDPEGFLWGFSTYRPRLVCPVTKPEVAPGAVTART